MRNPQVQALRSVVQDLRYTKRMCWDVRHHIENAVALQNFDQRHMLLMWFLVGKILLDDSMALEDWIDETAYFHVLQPTQLAACVRELHRVTSRKIYKDAMPVIYDYAESLFEWKHDVYVLREGKTVGMPQGIDLFAPDGEESPDDEVCAPASSSTARAPSTAQEPQSRRRLASPTRPPRHLQEEPDVKYWTQDQVHGVWVKKDDERFWRNVHDIVWRDARLPAIKQLKRDRLQEVPMVLDDRLRFKAGIGCFPWNIHKNRPLRHCFRANGERPPIYMKGQDWKSLAAWQEQMPGTGRHMGQQINMERGYAQLVTWLKHRPTIWGPLVSIERVPDAYWTSRGMHSCFLPERESGCWWKLSFDFTQPDAALDVEGIECGWHGTSMYCLQRIIKNKGPFNGWAENSVADDPVSGVFYMADAQAHLCHTYVSYNSPLQDGMVFGVLLQLHVRRREFQLTGKKSTIKRRTKRSNCDQHVADSEFVRLNSVFVRQQHIMEMVAMPRSEGFSVESWWNPLLEIDPEEDIAAIIARSKVSGMEGCDETWDG